MSRISFLQDIWSTVLERRLAANKVEDERSLEELCLALLSARGEVSGNRLSTAILQRFNDGSEADKLAFFTWMLNDLDIDTELASEAVAAYGQINSPTNWQALVSSTEPRRLELLRRINRISGATGRLVTMRENLRAVMKANPQLARVDADFERLFKSWFNRGFLVLREIDWTTPANILEKLIRYEAVHAINDWDDLRRRLEPPDRKCFAFFHPAMQDDPLIFVEVALTAGLPASVQEVLHAQREPIAVEAASVAIFYSISNCQPGLRGVSFGNFLIKHVATELASNFPDLVEFRTLSPVPTLAHWLKSSDQNVSGSTFRDALALATGDETLYYGDEGANEGMEKAESRMLSDMDDEVPATDTSLADSPVGNDDVAREVELTAEADRDPATDVVAENASQDSAGVVSNNVTEPVTKMSDALLEKEAVTDAMPLAAIDVPLVSPTNDDTIDESNPPAQSEVDNTNETDLNLLGLAAHYLVKEKRTDKQPRDPVARFHLGNGASLDAVLPDADTSLKGKAQSAGIMVSYLYDLDKVVSQHEAYAGSHTVTHSKAVAKLLGTETNRFRFPGVRRSA